MLISRVREKIEFVSENIIHYSLSCVDPDSDLHTPFPPLNISDLGLKNMTRGTGSLLDRECQNNIHPNTDYNYE